MNIITIYSNSEDITTSSTLSYTGMSVPIPARSGYLLLFRCVYNTQPPLETRVSSSSSSIEQYVCYASNDNGGQVSVCGYNANYSPLTLYLWARYASVSITNASIQGVFLKKP